MTMQNIKQHLNLIIRTFLISFLFFFTSCQLLQDNQQIPQNYSPQVNNTINQTQQTNQTNTTNVTIVEPPKPVLLPIKDKLAIYVLDTSKKGTSIITINENSMLINMQGGSDGLRILKTIKNLGINKLNYFIVTNDDVNNIDGVVPILLKIPPLHLIHSGIPSNNEQYKEYTLIFPNATEVPFDTIIGFGDAIVNLIVPYDDKQPTLLSDSSVVVKLNYGNNKFLFLTDCAIDCETRISNINANVIVSNGGCNSLNYGLLKDVNVQLVIFSGVPCQETLERVKSLDLKYLITSNDGDVIITSDGVNYDYRNLKTR